MSVFSQRVKGQGFFAKKCRKKKKEKKRNVGYTFLDIFTELQCLLDILLISEEFIFYAKDENGRGVVGDAVEGSLSNSWRILA
jgi:hypothetical protein